MPLKDDWVPGQTGLTQAVNDAASTVNAHEALVTTGRLSDPELTAKVVGVLAEDDTVKAAVAASVAALIVPVTAGDPAKAEANRAALQSALDGGGRVEVHERGVVWITDTLLIPSNTHLYLERDTVIKTTGWVPSRPTVQNARALTAEAAVTSFTSATYDPATGEPRGVITVDYHTLAVGDWVYVNGATTSGYNGTFRVVAVTATTITVRMPFKPAATAATGAPKFRAADCNITISGGEFDANRTDTTYSDGVADMNMIFHGVGNLLLEDVVLHDSWKYSLLLGGTSVFRTRNVRVDNTEHGSDGIHLGGSNFTGLIEGTSGRTGDDFVSFTIGDYPQFEISRGDMFDVTVRDTTIEYSAKNGVKLTGSAPFFHKKITVDGLAGAVQLYASQIYDDNFMGYLVGTQGDEFVLRNVNIACRKILEYQPTGKFTSIVIENANLDRVGFVAAVDAVTIGNGDTGTAYVGSLTLRNLYTLGNTSLTSLVRVNIAQIDALTLEGCNCVGSSGMSAVLQKKGRIGQVTVTRCRFKTWNEIYRQDLASGIDDGTVFVIDNTLLDGGVRISELQAAGKVFVGPGVVCLTLSSLPFKATKAGKTVEYFGGPMISPSNVDIGTGAASVNVSGQLRCAGGVVSAPAIGAAFWNTDTTWASGSGTDKRGYYGWNGPVAGTWTKLYGYA